LTATRGRAYTPEERRAYLVSFLAFFVAGLSVFLSVDLEGGRFMAYAWFVIPVGVAAGAAIFFFLRAKEP
jgi:uncharacterized membrane protein YhhN